MTTMTISIILVIYNKLLHLTANGTFCNHSVFCTQASMYKYACMPYAYVHVCMCRPICIYSFINSGTNTAPFKKPTHERQSQPSIV